MQGTSLSFAKLIEGRSFNWYPNEACPINESSARISVGVFAGVLVRVESQGHTVNVNKALIGGLELNHNKEFDYKLNENLRVLKNQVENRNYNNKKTT